MSKRFTLNEEDVMKWLKNVAMFTMPTVAVLFGLMAQGVPFSKAWPVSLLALYGAIADLAKKWSSGETK